MEETIHINFDGYKNDNYYVSISKTRIWPPLLASSDWIIKNALPGSTFIRNGIGLTLITNLSIVVEGFLTDILMTHLDNGLEKKPKILKKLQTEKWKFKVELYNESFEKQLSCYCSFKAIEILFDLRNNLAHGLTHCESVKTNIKTGEQSMLESVPFTYQKARLFFIEKGFLKDSSISSNIQVLWKLEISAYFLSVVKKFLSDVIANNESTRLIAISNELETVLKM